ncbi:MAG TPA: hypothetical protein VJ859_10285 [Allosphingosinicella sp.]|nr:hypothetical protein [Allosphingosinicella sp.]
MLLDEVAFFSRREELTGIATPPGDRHMLFDRLAFEPSADVLKTVSAKFHSVDYSKSDRRRAWRNAMVAGINAALSRRLFSLRPGDNRWPGARREPHAQQSAHVFRFEIEGIPAVASLWDAGWDEISVHVAFWPTRAVSTRTESAGVPFAALM